MTHATWLSVVTQHAQRFVVLLLLGSLTALSSMAKSQEPPGAPREGAAHDATEGAPYTSSDDKVGAEGETSDDTAPPEYEGVVEEGVVEEDVASEGALEADLSAGPASAIEGAATESDEIVVTAQFREQNPQDTPLSITAISAEDMNARSQVDIADVARQTPNTRLSQAPAAFGPSLQAHIRGVGQNDFSFALEPGVGIYVDDVYYATLTGSVLDLLDLERVEVLRGPQGTLAGQNSIGGAIKLYSRKPQGDNTGFVEITAGRFRRMDVRAAGDFTIVDKKLFGRISGVARHSDGYVTRYDYACTHPGTGVPTYQISDKCKLGTEGGKSYSGGRVSLRFLPVDKVEVSLIGDFTHDTSEAAPSTLLYVGSLEGAGLPADMPPSLVFNGVPLGTAEGSEFIAHSPFGSALDTYSSSPYINYSTYSNPAPLDGSQPYSIPPDYQVDSGGVAGRLEIEVMPELKLTSITAYRAYDGAWALDEGTPLSSYLVRNRVTHRQFTEELRLGASLFDKRIDLTVGGFYLDRNSHYGGRIDLLSLQFVEDSDIPASTIAAFTNAEWHALDGLEVIAGARYTTQKKDFVYGRTAVAGFDTPPLLAPLDGTVGTFEGDRMDWRGAVQYRWNEELMTYVQVATGFKSGGVNPRPFFVDQALPHDPETLIAYEIGAKSDWLDRRVRLNVAGFFNQYSNILMTVGMCPAPSTAVPCLMPINAGEANVMGVELETTISPVRQLSIDGSLSFLEFKYTSISEAGASSMITKDMSGPFAPKWQASLGVQYEVAVADSGSITPRLDFSYIDNYFTNPLNSKFSEVEGYGLLNGRVTWRSPDEDWLVAAEITNILNTLYYRNIDDQRSFGFVVKGQPGPPLRFALSVRRNFY